MDIKYLDKQDPRQTDKKVLLFRHGYINPYYDNGDNGVGDNIHALKVSSAKEGKEMVLLFKSELYQYIWNINKHSAYNHGGLMNSVFRDVSKIDDFTDIGIYNFFNITKQEQQSIKHFLGLKDTSPKEEGSQFRKTRKHRK